jgi:hypothetical protein
MRAWLALRTCRPTIGWACFARRSPSIQAPCSSRRRATGKTTRAPLALLDEPWAKGKRLILLEPRRITARATARMAATHFGALLYVNIGAMPGSAFAIARR